MIIKKYQAANETDAIILAKEELGKNVIIMNVKKVNPKGIARIFKKSRVEVTAAIDDGKSYKDAVEKADKEALASIKTEDKDVSSNKSKDKNKKNNTKIFKMKKDEEDLKAMYSKELDETENKVQKAKAKKAELQKDELDNSSKEKLEEQLFKVLAQKQEEK